MIMGVSNLGCAQLSDSSSYPRYSRGGGQLASQWGLVDVRGCPLVWLSSVPQTLSQGGRRDFGSQRGQALLH